MESYKFKGKVISIGELFESGSSDFKKQAIAIETDGDYKEKIPVEFIKGKIELLDVVNIGSIVEVTCNVRGREWENPQGEKKYFLSLSCWKLEIK